MTILSVLLASNAISFAATDVNNDSNSNFRMVRIELTDTQRDAIHQARLNSIESAAESLVDSGILSSDEANSIIEISSSVPAKNQVRQGIDLTDAQRNALHEEFNTIHSEGIDQLVKEGIITPEIADQMTAGPRGTKVCLDLTDTQRDAIQKVMTEGLEKAVANLVKDSVLTEDQAADLLERPNREIGVKRAGIFQNLTTDQKNALEKAIQSNFESEVANLVEDSTISQELADQILESGGNRYESIGKWS